MSITPKLTHGYRLPARFVIHTVGPVWRGGDKGEAADLASAYANSLRLAEAHGLASIAFPAISTGVFGYPKAAAARIAVETVRATLKDCPHIKRVIFCCFSADDAETYRRLL